MTEPILIVTGPTASGKSALAIELAEELGAELVSMDSMAVYRRMDIGTAKPSAAERDRVPHHLIDVVGPEEPFDTATWCRLAQEVVDQAAGSPRIFVGGTPLYLMAFFKGMLEGPSADPELRARLEAAEDREPGCLHRQLTAHDPAAAQRIHVRDRKRLVRALEVFERTGRPISEQQDTFHASGWRVPCRVLWIDRDREELKERVKLRTRAMLDDGLLDETRAIRDEVGFSASAAAAIGYAECLRHLERPFKDDEELRNRIRRSTHRLIRRQTTWLRRVPGILRMAEGFDLSTARRILADARARG